MKEELTEPRQNNFNIEYDKATDLYTIHLLALSQKHALNSHKIQTSMEVQVEMMRWMVCQGAKSCIMGVKQQHCHYNELETSTQASQSTIN